MIFFYKASAVVFLALLLSACAAPTVSFVVSSPKIVEDIKSNIVVPLSYEATWNKMVKNLSDRFFVINNIDKVSRIINVSYYSENAEDFIDCGTATTSVSGEPNQTISLAEDQSFPVAAWTDIAWGRGYVMRSRDVAVEGRINIYVAPLDDQTEIKVNSKYIVTVNEQNSLTQPIDTGLTGFSLPPFKTYKLTFNTNGRSSGHMICTSNGQLEREVLDTVRIGL